MGNVQTNFQYQRPPIPASAPADLKRCLQGIFDVLDEIYAKYGRLNFKHLSPGVKEAVESKVSNGDFESAVTQLHDAISLSISAAINGVYQKVSGITIDSDGVAVYGKKFTVQDVDGSDPAFLVDAIAKVIKAHAASLGTLALSGPLTGTGHNVVLRQAAGTVYLYPGGSSTANQGIIDAAARFLSGTVRFYLTSGNYSGNLHFSNFTGALLEIEFDDTAYFNGSMNVSLCKQVSMHGHGDSVDTYGKMVGALSYVLRAENTALTVYYMRLTGGVRASPGTGTLYGLMLDGYCQCAIENSIVERTNDHAIFVGKCCIAFINNVIGGQSGGYTTLANLGSGTLAYQGAMITVNDKVPLGNAENLASWSAPDIQGAATPMGSPGTYTPPTQYSVQYVYNSAKYCDLPTSANMGTASSVWSASAPRGGLWTSQSQRYSGMWLLERVGGGVENILTLLSGKMIISATLRVHCVDCWSGSVEHDLYYMRVNTLPVGGDSPASRLTDSGLNIALANGQDTVVDIKPWLQSMVDTGTAFYGFGLGLAGSYVKMDTTCELDIVYQ